MGKMRDSIKEWTWRHDTATLIITLFMFLLVLPIVGCTFLNGWMNTSFNEGYEIVIEGAIQLHRMEYSRGPWWSYPYTAMELRTFSGDTHHLELYGHHPLIHGQLYKITYTRISPLGNHQFMIGKVIEIKMLS